MLAKARARKAAKRKKAPTEEGRNANSSQRRDTRIEPEDERVESEYEDGDVRAKITSKKQKYFGHESSEDAATAAEASVVASHAVRTELERGSALPSPSDLEASASEVINDIIENTYGGDVTAIPPQFTGDEIAESATHRVGPRLGWSLSYIFQIIEYLNLQRSAPQSLR